jgi:hypothetical protein
MTPRRGIHGADVLAVVPFRGARCPHGYTTRRCRGTLRGYRFAGHMRGVASIGLVEAGLAGDPPVVLPVARPRPPPSDEGDDRGDGDDGEDGPQGRLSHLLRFPLWVRRHDSHVSACTCDGVNGRPVSSDRMMAARR